MWVFRKNKAIPLSLIGRLAFWDRWTPVHRMTPGGRNVHTVSIPYDGAWTLPPHPGNQLGRT